MSEALRALPSVHDLVEDAPVLRDAVESYGRAVVVEAAREVLAELRARLVAEGGGSRGPGHRGPDEFGPDRLGPGQIMSDDPSRDHFTPGHLAPDHLTPSDLQPASVAGAVLRRLATWHQPRPRWVINATGVILHTNLGRAPVSAAAAEAMRAASAGYSDLEYDLETGERGSRHALVAPLLCRLSGAEAAMVVNNNAGATLLALTALAHDRGVLVSRGQLVEIGGGYRIPTILAAGGARLVEVGTTNRTRIGDYRAALNDETALILRVHTSNFRVLGFTEAASLAEMVELGRQAGIPVMDDLGSGSFLDTTPWGLAAEPLVPASVAAGADLVCFSGDKLLGGPQAGVLVGTAATIARLRAHPFARALRPGKDILAGIHATLLHYLRGQATSEVPVWRMISASPRSLAERASTWQAELARSSRGSRLMDGQSTVGGGSLPGETMPTTLLVLDGTSSEWPAPDELAAALRRAPVPVVARIDQGAVVLDPRTVLPGEDEHVVAAILAAVSGGG